MMPTLLSFDSEFTSLFPPGEIGLLAQFTSDKRNPFTRFSLWVSAVLIGAKNDSL
jgi:hypothetical protein